MRRFDNGRRSILLIGIFLLGVMTAGLFYATSSIRRASRASEDFSIRQMGSVTFNMIRSQIMGIEKNLDFISLQLSSPAVRPEETFEITDLVTLLDPRIDAIWTYWVGEVRWYSVTADSPLYADRQGRERNIRDNTGSIAEGPSRSTFIYWHDGEGFLSFCHRVADDYYAGMDISLSKLNEYIAVEVPLNVTGYVILTDKDFRVLYHPDSRFTGTVLSIAPTAGPEPSENHVIIDSPYLDVPVIRTIHPLVTQYGEFFVLVNIPAFNVGEYITDFRKYSVWIMLGSVLLFTVFIYFSIGRLKKENLRRVTAEQESSQLKLGQVVRQMQPHFLFNSLNTLYSLINRDPGAAREFVLNLSKVYRYILENRNRVLVPLADEIEFLNRYIYLLRVRFPGQLCFNIEEELCRTPGLIPSMSLQVLIENAVKHNSFSLSEPLEIHIFLKGPVVVVENNYSPPLNGTTGDSTGVGIETLRAVYAYYTTREVRAEKKGDIFRCELPILHPDI